VIDMATTMSKILNIGVPLERVIEMSTVAPAREINRPELGTLSPGAPADIAVLALDEGDFTFVDCERTTMQGNQRLRCEMTFFDGEIAWNPSGRGWPIWVQDLRDNPTPLHVRSQDF
jgi:dihydroorotase